MVIIHALSSSRRKALLSKLDVKDGAGPSSLFPVTVNWPSFWENAGCMRSQANLLLYTKSSGCSAVQLLHVPSTGNAVHSFSVPNQKEKMPVPLSGSRGKGDGGTKRPSAGRVTRQLAGRVSVSAPCAARVRCGETNTERTQRRTTQKDRRTILTVAIGFLLRLPEK